jgi:hypothetical protein
MTSSTGSQPALSPEETQKLRSQLTDLVQRISAGKLQQASSDLNRLATEEPIIICVSGCG